MVLSKKKNNKTDLTKKTEDLYPSTVSLAFYSQFFSI